MAKITKEDVLKTVTTFYLESYDFNGIPTWTLSEKSNQDWALLKTVVKELIEDEMVGLIDTNTDLNPHIIRIGFQENKNMVRVCENCIVDNINKF